MNGELESYKPFTLNLVRWIFSPFITVEKNEDGTFRIELDLEDSFSAAYDERGYEVEDESFDGYGTGPEVLDQYFKTNGGIYQILVDHFELETE